MAVQSVFPSGNAYTDSLLTGVRWSSSSLTFGFPTSATQFTGYADGEPFSNFEPLSFTQQAAVRAIFASISTFSALTFSDLPGGSAVLRFGLTDDSAAAHAYLPAQSDLGGDSWYRNTGGFYDTPHLGNYAWFTFMHEIGHALGLGHPHEASPAMPLDRDFMAYSVMSYRSSSYGDFEYSPEEWNFAQSYMMEDVAALQFLYGPNYNHNSGSTVYQWSPTTGEMFINGVGAGTPGGNRIFLTLWDGGGVDTFDFSNYVISDSWYVGVLVDLRPGHWTALPPGQTASLGGYNPGNIASALLYNNDPRSLIENATGTNARDTIWGNDAANVLNGGAGNDTLYASAGNDTLIGGLEADILWGGDGDDSAIGGDGADQMHGENGNDRLEGGFGEDYLSGGDGDDSLIGGDGNDGLNGDAGADVLESGAGDDHLDGGAGNDRLLGADGNDSLQGGAGNDVLIGGVGDDTYFLDGSSDEIVELEGQGTDTVQTYISYVASLAIENVKALGFSSVDITGNTLDNQLTGNAAANVLNGGAGADFAAGGEGDDIYYVDNALDFVFEYENCGTDTVYSSIDYALSEAPPPPPGYDPYAGASLRPWYSGENQIERLILTGSSGLSATGNSSANLLQGNASNNILSGQAGNDTLMGRQGADELMGGVGADTFVYVAPADSTAALYDWLRDFESGSDRIDLTQIEYYDASLIPEGDSTWLQVTTAAGTPMLVLISGQLSMYDLLLGTQIPAGTADVLYGTDWADTLDGSYGHDTLVGRAGNDTLIGGYGNDVFFVDSAGDVVVEGAGKGQDRAASSVSYEIAAEAEVEILETSLKSGTDAIGLTGNGFAQHIYGNAGNNTLRGGGGDDALHAFEGNDYLVGDLGLDSLYGGAGDDRYYIGSADGDRIWEFAGEGYDTVAAEADYELPDVSYVERLEAGTLSATTALYLGGSSVDNLIIGNEGVNRLRGFTGNDVLHGLGGDDYLIGDEGADVMYGGAGNDTYYVNTSDDRIFENPGEGMNDRVATEVSFTLPDEAEVEVLEAVNLTATSGIELGGSRYDNTIAGDAGNNVLRGFGGHDTLTAYAGDDILIGDQGYDTMIGGAGNDTYYVDSDADVVVELAGEGDDRVSSAGSYTLAADAEVETLEASSFASTYALNLTGSNSDNLVIGNHGANWLDGKGGNDTLVGAGGADTFVFTSGLGSGNIDRIDDFQAGIDRIALDNAILTGLNPGSMDPNRFVVGAGAQDADDRIIYNPANGALLFDVDGSGAKAAVEFAWLNSGLDLTASDLLII